MTRKSSIILHFLLTALLLVACEQEDSTELAEFNVRLSEQTTLGTPEEIAQEYLEFTEIAESDWEIFSKKLHNNSFKIILIRELEDDSIHSEEIEMKILQKDSTWKVQEILKSQKCRKGRGHQYYSSKKCD